MRASMLIGVLATALNLSCGGTMSTGGCPQGCQAGFICQNNACVPSGGSCVPACQAGFTCQGTTCVPASGSCTPACQSGFLCQGTTCVLDPSGSWSLTVTSGSISEKKADGSAWDFPGGLPDGLVCLTIQGTRTCTPTKSDTLMPRWDHSFPAATATGLQSGVGIEFLDEDVAANDTICAGSRAVTVTEFAARAWKVMCQGTGSGFSATLNPR